MKLIIYLPALNEEKHIRSVLGNLPKVLELTLHDGVDPRSGKRIGLATGPIDSFDDLFAAYRRQLRHLIGVCQRYGRSLPGWRR